MLAYLLIICVAFYFVSTTLIRLVGEYLFMQKVREEQRLTESLAANASYALNAADAQTLYAIASGAVAESESRVLVLDNYGVAQADSASQYNGQRFTAGEVAAALSGAGAAYGFYGLGAENAIMNLLAYLPDGSTVVGLYAAPIHYADRVIGALVYITLSQDVYESLHTIQRQMLTWLMLVALLVALLSFYVVSRLVIRPIDILSQGIARMSQNDLSSRVNIRGSSEFAQLANAFNMMCERLEQVDQTRNQFVSNASHELKTPLSTMKILIETLMYQEEYNPEMQGEFLADVNREIDRLNSIVNDLLTLVHIDSGTMELKQSEVPLDQVLLDAVRRLTPLAQKRGISIEFGAHEELSLIGDAAKLDQVFYNLIDNAIKYTPQDGRVTVGLARVGKRAIATVSDTGVGIPKADQPHIFDRFYRVDRARSRDTGGTGLGLSIVKQIVSMHGGSIVVASEENAGTTFTVELPIEEARV